MKNSIDIDKDNRFLGYHYGLGKVLAKPISPQPGMFFINGETNSVWVWDSLTKMWIDTNRVDSGLKGMLTDEKGNSPSDFIPSPQVGVKESYFYMAEHDDVDANPNATPKTIIFTYFKNGANSVSVNIRKTSIVTLFWNGNYWEVKATPFINLDYSVYATKTELNKLDASTQQFTISENITVNKFFKELYVVPTKEDFVIDKLYLTSFSRSVVQESGDLVWSVVFNRGGGVPPLYFRTTKNPELNSVIEFDLVETDVVAKLYAVVDWDAIDEGVKFSTGLNIPLRYWNNLKYSPCIDSYIKNYGKRIEELEEDLEKVTNPENKTFGSDILIENGFYSFQDKEIGDTATTGVTPTSSKPKRSAIKEVKRGDVYELKSYVTSAVNGAAYPWVLTDSDRIIINKPEALNTFDLLNGVMINVEKDGYLYLCCNEEYFDSFSLTLYSKQLELNLKIESLETKIQEIRPTNNAGFYMPNKKVLLSGASISQYNGYFEYAMEELGLSYKNISEAGTNIFRLCFNLYSEGRNYNDVDILITSHIHNFDVYSLPKHLENYTPSDYENDDVLGDYIKTRDYYMGNLAPIEGVYTSDELYAIGYDYVIKKWNELCYNLKGTEGYDSVLGKPCQIILYTYWHDARTIFNTAIRKLANKWGLPLIKDDENIGFSKDKPHLIAKKQYSLLHCDGYPWGQKSEYIDGIEYGLHPTGIAIDEWNNFLSASKEEKLAMLPYIQIKRASILIDFIKNGAIKKDLIEIDDEFNINNYTTQGVYYICGERTSTTDNLPIMNASPGHTISGQLTVLDASLSDAEQCITQYLKLTNRLGSEGKEYIRTYNKYSNGSEGWSAWRELKQTTNLNQISDAELKNCTENGMYEGVIVGAISDLNNITNVIEKFLSTAQTSGGADDIPTGSLFTMNVLNNYAVVQKVEEWGFGVIPRSVTQRAKALLITGQYAEIQRTLQGDVWSGWKMINM